MRTWDDVNKKTMNFQATGKLYPHRHSKKGTYYKDFSKDFALIDPGLGNHSELITGGTYGIVLANEEGGCSSWDNGTEPGRCNQEPIPQTLPISAPSIPNTGVVTGIKGGRPVVLPLLFPDPNHNDRQYTAIPLR